MAEAESITDPNSLQKTDVIISLSSLNIGTSESSSNGTQQTKLVLLQPLANADTLETCRDPNSRQTRHKGISNHEYLNIQPLSKAWRQALLKVPPISHLTFDLALPKEEDQKSNGSFQKVFWDISMPQEACLGIRARDVMTLVVTIATGMRMRAGDDLQFDLIYDESEGVSLRAMALLKKQLLALAEAKAPGEKQSFDAGHEVDID